jgi:dienelactone hydrolase
VEEARYWRIETVSFDAGYSDERMFMYLYLPNEEQPSYKTIIFWPGIDGLLVNSFPKEKVHLGFALKNGYAVAYPILYGTYERNKSTSPRWNTPAGRSLAMQQVRDFRRALDYLEERPDIDRTSLGYYGVSWGGRMGPIVLAVEPRLKLGILNQAGIEPNVHNDINTIHYVSRVNVPVLQFNGRYDADFRYEDQAKPLFEGIRTDPADKKWVVAETGHFVPQPIYIGESLDWLDKYLDPANRR